MGKYGILITSPISREKNIGDYIQSIAAQQFLPQNSNYDYIEKEQLADIHLSEPTKVIMNAWYMWHPDKWPPTDENIIPLLTSMHISPLVADEMLGKRGKEYLMRYGPVGCRDTGTMETLNQHNIPNYFSGCLTLTLGRSYNYNPKKDKIIFVDPYFPPIRYIKDNKTQYNPRNIIKAFFSFLKSPSIVHHLTKKKFFKGRFKIQTYYNASIFYHSYSNLFSNEVLEKADYISHMVSVHENVSQAELFATADNLLKEYSQARYVVTSRIHCALPCLGIGTPVIFVLDKVMNDAQNSFAAPGRFGGLLEFFRIAKYNNNKVTTNDPVLEKLIKLSFDSTFNNKLNWMVYMNNLVDVVTKFINNSKK